MSIKFFPSTKRLAKKHLLPIPALLLLYIFVVIPDEDIGLASGTGFFSTLTVIISFGIIFLIITYFRELSMSKKKPILIINEEKAVFPRKKVTLNFGGEYKVSAKETASIESDGEGSEFGFMIDKNESYIRIFKDNKKKREIRMTYLDMNTAILSELINNLNAADKENRARILHEFSSKILSEAPEDIKSRMEYSEGNQ